jgi:hypothetical protein
MRQAGLSLLVGIGIGLTAAFLLVAHDRSQRAVEALGRAYEASRPTGTPVVQAVPIENPPAVSPGSAAQGGAPQTAQNPDQNAVQPPPSSHASTDTPLVSGGAPGGTSRASGEGTSRAVPFLGVRCESGYITGLWPNGPFHLASAHVRPQHLYDLPLGGPGSWLLYAVAIGNVPREQACKSLKNDVLTFEPGTIFTIRVVADYDGRTGYHAFRVRLTPRPTEATNEWF